MPNTDLTNGEICVKLDDLSKNIKEGFRGIHDRQDKTNGKVIVNTEYRLRTIGSMSTMKWLVGFFGIGTIANFISIFLK